MRLIDADALKERAIRVSTVKEHCYMKAVGTHEIDKAPTVDAIPTSWLHEKLTGNPEISYSVTASIVRVLYLWEKEKEVQNG